MKKVFITDKQGNKVLPKTHVSAVYDDEGNDLGSHLGAFEDEVRGLVDTPHQEYVTVATYASLPASGSKDTIYRVSNYDGSQSQVNPAVYSEYAWNGTQYVFLCVKSAVGEVFDITVYNNNTKYADLTAALGVNGVNIPESLRKGGMSVKFVQSSDNKYVQARCMAQNFTTDVTQWQGVDIEPSYNSKNLVESGGVAKYVKTNVYTSKQDASLTITNDEPKLYLNTLYKASSIEYVCKGQTWEQLIIRINYPIHGEKVILSYQTNDTVASVMIANKDKNDATISYTYTNKSLVVEDNTDSLVVIFNINGNSVVNQQGTVITLSNLEIIYDTSIFNTVNSISKSLLPIRGKVSIIGDSISTFAGTLPSGYNTFYPQPSLGVTNLHQTWFDTILTETNSSLEVNASYGGSSAAEFGEYPDFYVRTNILGNPDVIFVALGTNDSTRSIQLGDYDFDSSISDLSESTFRTAYTKGVKSLLANYPNAKIVLLIFKMDLDYKNSIKTIGDYYGLNTIDCSDYIAGDIYNHPTAEGMSDISISINHFYFTGNIDEVPTVDSTNLIESNAVSRLLSNVYSNRLGIISQDGLTLSNIEDKPILDTLFKGDISYTAKGLQYEQFCIRLNHIVAGKTIKVTTISTSGTFASIMLLNKAADDTTINYSTSGSIVVADNSSYVLLAFNVNSSTIVNAENTTLSIQGLTIKYQQIDELSNSVNSLNSSVFCPITAQNYSSITKNREINNIRDTVLYTADELVLKTTYNWANYRITVNKPIIGRKIIVEGVATNSMVSNYLRILFKQADDTTISNKFGSVKVEETIPAGTDHVYVQLVTTVETAPQSEVTCTFAGIKIYYEEASVEDINEIEADIQGLNVRVSSIESRISDDLELSDSLAPVPAILDLGWGGDVDDAIALRTLCYYEHMGSVRVAGVYIWNQDIPNANGIRAGLEYDGVYDVPICSKLTPSGDGSANVYSVESAAYPHSKNGVDGVGVKSYRKMLVSIPNKCIIIANGPTTSLSELLNSAADEVSELTGAQLVTQKVARLYMMGGAFPDSTVMGGDHGNAEYNLAMDKAASANIISNWPTPIIFNGWEVGRAIKVGGNCYQKLPANDFTMEMMRVWNIHYGGTSTNGIMVNGRDGYDPINTICACVGDVRKFGFELVRGTVTYNSTTGTNGFTESLDGNHYYVKKIYDVDYYQMFANHIISKDWWGNNNTAISGRAQLV